MISKNLDLLPIRSQRHRVAKNHGLISAVLGVKIFSLPLSWICSYDIPELKNFPYATALFLTIEKVIR